MSDSKILCPWCGAEMDYLKTYLSYSDTWEVAMRCGNHNCRATGPFRKHATELGAMNRASVATARMRITESRPLLIEPMPWEEIMDGSEVVWIEDRGYTSIAPCEIEIEEDGIGNVNLFMIGTENASHMLPEQYGKTWRCWERKPTDEERSAAEWL